MRGPCVTFGHVRTSETDEGLSIAYGRGLSGACRQGRQDGCRGGGACVGPDSKRGGAFAKSRRKGNARKWISNHAVHQPPCLRMPAAPSLAQNVVGELCGHHINVARRSWGTSERFQTVERWNRAAFSFDRNGLGSIALARSSWREMGVVFVYFSRGETAERGCSRKRCDRQGIPCLAKFCTRLAGPHNSSSHCCAGHRSLSSHYYHHVSSAVLLLLRIVLPPRQTKETVRSTSSPRSHPHPSYRQQ